MANKTFYYLCIICEQVLQTTTYLVNKNDLSRIEFSNDKPNILVLQTCENCHNTIKDNTEISEGKLALDLLSKLINTNESLLSKIPTYDTYCNIVHGDVKFGSVVSTFFRISAMGDIYIEELKEIRYILCVKCKKITTSTDITHSVYPLKTLGLILHRECIDNTTDTYAKQLTACILLLNNLISYDNITPYNLSEYSSIYHVINIDTSNINVTNFEIDNSVAVSTTSRVQPI